MLKNERKEYRRQRLQNDISTYNARSWRINKPGRDFSVRLEDFVPAIAGVIGKVSLAGAFALAWMDALKIDNSIFAVENVRLELLIASILTLIFCATFNPAMAPPGTLAPLIPLVPVMAVAGVHPLPLAIISGVIAMLVAVFRAWPRLLRLSGIGTKAGVLILFGLMGTENSIMKLMRFSDSENVPWLTVVLIIAGAAAFFLLYRQKKVWLAIPMAVAVGLLLPLVAGLHPVIVTGPGLPILNPSVWWNELWGIGWGFEPSVWLASLPYALLIVIMWPLDAVAITAMHERNYLEHSERLIFRINPTFLLVGLRNIVGTFLGGAQTAAVWRSFLIPLGVVRRPLPGAALLLALLGISFSLLGYPLDIAMFAPLLNLVLIFGVFVPMLLTGLVLPQKRIHWLPAVLCVLAGYFFDPLAGWLLAVLSELLLKRLAARAKRGRL